MHDRALHAPDLTIATIFSFAPNEADSADGILDDESFDTEGLDHSSRDFLDMAIADYNKAFKTHFDTSSKGFQDYYKDLSDKVKKREVDLLIVVNMFLTGFDATTLNTLWVDKNLKMHGLIQAFSRTNRILNSVKTFGNIVCFRDLEKETNDAIALFGDKEAALFRMLFILRTHSIGSAAFNLSVTPSASFICCMILSNRSCACSFKSAR